eukprot:CAMPEP_0175454418 /NCGR_PEP_ID=MMETSP0095-20121207/64480_1 /TAXON_ID=311494 /ORGANISM="Alexandrium monilatum, Strain CCMP3105" /LENGTH=47 /DNA_ID= /DNA_START= /DNA_END= /DNA_ORIENTATION=
MKVAFLTRCAWAPEQPPGRALAQPCLGLHSEPRGLLAAVRLPSAAGA